LKNKNLHIFAVVLIIYSLFIWYPVLNFEFLRANEPYWLGSGATENYNFLDIYQSHSHLYLLDYILFGWNAQAWYLTGLITHTIGSICLIILIYSLLERFSTQININYFIIIYGFIFIGSFVYLDVVSWGSFNSYYGLLLGLITTSTLFFLKYQNNQQKIFLIISFLLFLMSLLIRETGIYTIFFISLIILIEYQKMIFTNKYLFVKIFITKLAPYLLITLLILIFRNQVGGVAGDMTDENVRYRLILIDNKSYFELIWKIFLTFLRNIPTLFIPFEWLNSYKFILVNKYSLNGNFIEMYFYSFLGIVIYVPLTLLTFFKLLKDKAFGPILFIGWGIITFSLMFIALAVPSTDGVLMMDYNYFTRRYNYFAFAGAAIFWAYFLYFFGIILQKLVPKLDVKYCTLIFLIVMIVGNFYITRGALESVYSREHAEYKNFITNFKKICCDSNAEKIIYYNPLSPDINDFLFAMQLTKSWVFKEQSNTNTSPTWILETTIDSSFKKIKNKIFAQKDALFLSYSREGGIVNWTPEIIFWLNENLNIPLTLNNHNYLSWKNFGSPLASIPYDVELKVSKSDSFLRGSSSGKYDDFMLWFKNLIAKSGPSISQRTDEVFLKYKIDNAIDLNLIKDFNWGSDGIQNYIELNSKDKIDIHGLWIIAPKSDYLPTIYDVIDSNGDKVKYHSSQYPWGMLINFDTKIKDNKLKLVIKNTFGSYPLFSEINIISESIKNELLTTTDLPGILLKLKKEGSKLGFWVSIDYAIKYNSDEYIKHLDKFIFYTEAQQIIRIPLPEDERSEESLNSFMKKRITNIKITVDDSVIKNKFIESINFVSRY